MYKTILAATDGSEHADKAIETACDMAAKYGAKLVLVHVLLSSERAEPLMRWAEVEHIDGARPSGITTALSKVTIAKAAMTTPTFP